jgi:prepilin-type N-terminal cleavage/methylation domain-containing protein
MNKKGFTLIELLVVVSIIGLLATIVMVSLNSARVKARDVKRKADLGAIQIALELYYDKYGSYRVSGGGSGGGGQGWLSFENGTTYPSAVTRVLYNEDFLNVPLILDPTQGSTGYMIYLCDSYQTYAISATLETPSPEDIAYIQTTCNGSGGNGTYERYGKNYALEN